MRRSRILGVGSYVPARVVKNDDLRQWMDTSNEWIIERTGIEERRWVEPGEGPAELGTRATERALSAAGLAASDIQMIVLATLSPHHEFPGTAVFVQRQLGLSGIPALDIRQQCTGFIYGLSIADQYIKSGMYDRILVVGTEVHSTGLDLSTAGRDVAVIFGDGAGAVVVGPSDEERRGILSTHLHADGSLAEMLWIEKPGSQFHPRITAADLAEGRHYPKMQGRQVFKHAVTRMPEAVHEALAANQLALSDLDLLIPHQANLRISEMVQKILGLSDDRVYNNIQRYGNTTAASIPLALDECIQAGRVKPGTTVCLCAFGAGFTWGSALIRW
ncbi:MAG TPA: beta-ketoacyl-ACP synthase III [Polyangia bacterium]|nr:beta-ketoacyl-ACP synthase III [Polyangia bacterium]